MEEENNKTPRRAWNLMIGISLVLLGSLRLYNHIRQQGEWNFRSITIIIFIIFGGYLIFRHFLQPPQD
ncbi:hypothetical protein [Aquimarina spongiae]|uniref:Uncharacterized protein n=1 Tax=Aquimarina spongiae TaxID=570521 RepID=A0A1M6LLE7_9FLAO|nr:hypothetical protein [Aquimarina spongiae]SHJ71922.1 hypothetical protein SAMN04488508_11917 [Aquimarina spongiae]